MARTAILGQPSPGATSVVITEPDCDLERDDEVRFQNVSGDTALRNRLAHVELCDLFPEDQMKTLVPRGSDIWKLIVSNQN